MNILITGANGFLGSHLVETAISLGHKPFAAVRKDSNLSNLAASNPALIYVNYFNQDQLNTDLKNAVDEYGQFDIIIHNAGLTISNRKTKFEEVNVGITSNLTQVIARNKILTSTGKIIYVSSLAARGPDKILKPISSYGKSKLKSEQVISASGLAHIIIRPTAVYGPRDADFLKLFKIIKKGITPSMAPKSQQISMIFVKDLAKLILISADEPSETMIEAFDGNTYTTGGLNDSIGKLLGKKVISIPVPAIIARSIALAAEFSSRLFNLRPFITREKIAELTADWTVDKKLEIARLEFKSLEEGLTETLGYYQKNHLV